MTADVLLTRLRTRQAADLRTCFPGLSERELMQVLAAPPHHAVYILQHSFGCALEDAKAAWNDYVLRYLDGPSAGDHACSGADAALRAAAHLS